MGGANGAAGDPNPPGHLRGDVNINAELVRLRSKIDSLIEERDAMQTSLIEAQKLLEADIERVQTELNCAEEILDHFACDLNLDETSFDCIGDYITAVCQALKGSQSKP